MKTIFLIASAATLLAAPALSSAQTPDQRDAHHDKAEVRHDNTVVRRDNTIVRRDNAEVRHDNAVVRTDRWDRNNRTWWRGRPEFRDFAGVRPGFWYAPGRGYFRPDPRWYGFNWRVGVIAPPEFRTYYVQDPAYFGLPPAFPGFRYIYLNNNIALINVETGLIANIVPNVY